jgi:GntR family phosphonate transport system transcriptional regulator
MASNNRQAGGQLLRSAQVPADREVARALGIRLKDTVLMLELLRVADARPLSVSTHWFPKSRCDGIVQAYEQTRSITQALKQVGISDYVRASTRITTRLPMGDEGRLLKQARSQPVLVSESINLDPSGRPIEYVMARFASQRVQFVFEF